MSTGKQTGSSRAEPTPTEFCDNLRHDKELVGKMVLPDDATKYVRYIGTENGDHIFQYVTERGQNTRTTTETEDGIKLLLQTFPTKRLTFTDVASTDLFHGTEHDTERFKRLL